MSKDSIYIIIAVLVFLIGIIIYLISNKKKLTNLFYMEFGKRPSRKDYEINELKNFYKLSQEHDYNNFIDDITWNNLDLDEIYKEINICKSSVQGIT